MIWKLWAAWPWKYFASRWISLHCWFGGFLFCGFFFSFPFLFLIFLRSIWIAFWLNTICSFIVSWHCLFKDFVSPEHLQHGSQKFKILLMFYGIVSAFLSHRSKIHIISLGIIWTLWRSVSVQFITLGYSSKKVDFPLGEMCMCYLFLF